MDRSRRIPPRTTPRIIVALPGAARPQPQGEEP